MMKRKTYVAVWTVVVIAVLGLLPALMVGGCGKGEQEQPAAPQPQEAKKAEPAKPAAPAGPVQPPLGPVVPVTFDVLKLMPESAMIAAAVPPINGLYTKAVALAKRLVPSDVDMDAEIAKSVAQTAQDAGVRDAKSFADIARGKGLNPDAPLAVFVDLKPAAASAKVALATLKAEMDKQKAAAPKEGEPKPEGAPAAPAPSAPKPPNWDEMVSTLKPPAIAGVVGCADPVLAEQTVKEIVGLVGGYIDPAKVENVDVAGVTVHCYDPQKLAYAISGDKLVASNSLDLLKEVLARFNTPAILRYGTPECAASEPDEVVTLIRMDKIAPLAKELMPDLLAVQAPTSGMTDTQLAALNKYFDMYAGEDPGVITLAWTAKKIELLTRFDCAKHPGILEYAGEATPLRLAPLLPENTVLMLSMRFNDKLKENFKSGWLNALPPEVQQSPGLAQAVTYVNQVAEMIGDELTIGIAATTGSLPQIFLIAGLGNPEQTKGMIQISAPLTPSETYKGVEISLVAVPVPIPVYVAFPADTVMVSNDIAKLKAIIDLIQSKGTSKFLASLEPPFEANVPCYGALVLKTNILSDVIVPLSAFGSGFPPEVMTPVNKVTEVIREIRATKDMKGSWIEGRMSVLLK